MTYRAAATRSASSAGRTLPDLPAGVYQHYKGPSYLVLGYGHDSNEDGRDVVVYVGLQLDDAKPGPRLAVRTAADFLAQVCGEGECVAYGDVLSLRCQESGHARQRFAYTGPSYEPGRG